MSPETLNTFAHALHAIGWSFLPFLLLPLLFLLAPKIQGLKALCDAIISTIDGFNYRLGEFAKWGLVLLVLSVAASVLALSIFGLSWTKLTESAEYFHAGVIMLGSAATLLASKHVRVDIFHTSMKAETKALVDFIGFYALLLPVCLIILWNSQSFLYYSWLIFEGSPEADGIRGTFIIKTLVPLFSILMILQGFAISLRAALCLRGYQRPQRPEHTPKLYSGPTHTLPEVAQKTAEQNL